MVESRTQMSKWCSTCYRNKITDEWKSCDSTCPVFGRDFKELMEIFIISAIKESENTNTEATNFYAYKLESADDCMEITEHLSMNGYTFDTNCDRTIFIFDEEACYLETILKDRNIEYYVL